ncbi:hypothetical protein CFOL_v3_02148 [Cephalotus follicularis]|uniref:Uncharacterized protein n=1 Tax=Cephalotus follicularis TaxID=3775 RepID=A0A1Q3ASH0_CEPFO|nr:hypothetical protein CFOL_v3_02148 [Cephalotus follicularis]
MSLVEEQQQQQEHGQVRAIDFVVSNGNGSNLGVKTFFSSNQARLHPCRKSVSVKSVDALTFGSSTTPVEKKDPLAVWQEMKQNGFLSTSLGRVPTPKKSVKKRKHEICNVEKVEKINRIARVENNNRLHNIEKVKFFTRVETVNQLTKVERVNRFSKIAPPSGLLDQLSPGIINRVRSSNQVHSMLRAMLKREKLENVNAQHKQAGQLRESDVSECLNSFSDVGEGRGCSLSTSKPLHIQVECKKGDNDDDDDDDDDLGRKVKSLKHEADKDEMKSLSSVSMISENSSCMSSEESINRDGVSFVPRKDATVASQWLELLHSDITWRLAALKCSRIRVQDVIQTELPFLLSKEFSPNQKGDHSAVGSPITATKEIRQAKWNSMFKQMDGALHEEENQLEIWLNQVTEMQLQCEQGYVNWYGRHYLQNQSISDCGTGLMAMSNPQST